MHLSSLLDVNHILGTYGTVGIFTIIFIESGVFFFLPGDSLLFASGLLASTQSLNLVLVIIAASLAAFFGNVVGYYIGMHLEWFKRFKIFRKILRDDYIARAHDFFEARGKIAVVLSRFIPGIRTFLPWAAGVAKMDRQVFYAWSALGAAVWVLVMTVLGYFLGRAFPGIEKYLTETIVLIIVLSILPPIFGWLRGRAHHQ